ncbi:MAG TPA: type II CAAX endopeptidase family protein [Nocardioidaceae bacterium]|nr:type II CAAX endopeptidase family protein [Nocardioidaceae bacterium]
MTYRTPDHATASAVLNPSGRNAARALLPFTIIAVGIGVPLLAMSTVIKPEAPFMLASTLFGLALPALFLTHREGGSAAVRALLRDCVRLPSSWWWLPLAAFVLPVATWTAGAATGGATDLTWGLASFYVQDLIIGALVINIWEEMAWTGFFQRRAAGRWGVVGGALVTSLFFTALHTPLAFDGVHGLREVATNVALIAGVATGVRLLIARVDVWSGRSLLTVGILHSSFNASESLLHPDYDLLRIVVTIAIGVGVLAMGDGRDQRRGPRTGPAVARRQPVG